MKRWKFSLENVRSLKLRLEEDAARKLGEALTRASREKALLEETERRLRQISRDCASPRTTSAAELLRMSQYISLLHQQRKDRQAACIEAEKQLALARARLETAAREREILDKLRDRRKAEHEFHLAKQEQKWLDEMAQRARQGLLAPANA